MTPCLFSISYAGFWGQSVLGLSDFIRHAGKLGFDAWSPALHGESLYDAARLAAPHTIITTNAD